MYILLVVQYLQRFHIGGLKATLSIGALDDERLADVATDEGGERGPAERQAGEGVKRGPKDWQVASFPPFSCLVNSFCLKPTSCRIGRLANSGNELLVRAGWTLLMHGIRK